MLFYKTEKEYDVKSTIQQQNDEENMKQHIGLGNLKLIINQCHLFLNGKYYHHLIYQQVQVSNGIYFFRIICRLSFKTEPLKIYKEK